MDDKNIVNDLREKLSIYQMIIEIMSDYIFRIEITKDGDAKMTFASENFSKLTGRSIGDVQSAKSWAQIIYPEDLEKIMSFYKETIQSGEEGEIECRSYVKNSLMRWILIYIKPVWSESENRVVAVIGAIKDISEKKHAEINLMSTTIDDFRNFFKIEKDKVIFSIKEAILDTASIVGPMYKNNQIQLKILANGDILTYGYPNEYKQVLLNILHNARG